MPSPELLKALGPGGGSFELDRNPDEWSVGEFCCHSNYPNVVFQVAHVGNYEMDLRSYNTAVTITAALIGKGFREVRHLHPLEVLAMQAEPNDYEEEFEELPYLRGKSD